MDRALVHTFDILDDLHVIPTIRATSKVLELNA
eukprot:SAG31_NODE_3343_length_4381_cov_12.838393_8_plen_32_part_01